jgi:hypothetical protein
VWVALLCINRTGGVAHLPDVLRDRILREVLLLQHVAVWKMHFLQKSTATLANGLVESSSTIRPQRKSS